MDYTTKLSNNTNPSFSMARKELKQAANEYRNKNLNSSPYDAYIAGYEDAVNKACEWLIDVMYFDEYGLTHKKATMEDFINDFKNHMAQ